MAVATLTPISVPRSNVNPPAGVEVTFTASNQTGGGNRFVSTGREVVLVRNANTGSTARTVTVTSVAVDGRTNDITDYSVAAGAIAVLPKFRITGWRDSSGYITLTGSHAELEIAVLRLPDQ